MDGIAEATAGVANVVRLRIQSPEGAAAAERYGLELTPSYVLFDSEGSVVTRARSVDGATADRLRSLARR